MDYNIDFHVEGFYRWRGRAPSKELAEEFAKQAMTEVDFGELEDIEWDINTVEVDKE